MVAEVVILMILWVITCAACALSGFIVAKRIYTPRPREKPPDLPPEQQRKTDKIKREYKNFLNYDGSEQEDINAE